MSTKNDPLPIHKISYLPHIEADYQVDYWPFGERLLFKTNSLDLIAAADEAFSRFPEMNEAIDPLVITLLVTEGDEKPKVSDRIEPKFYTQGSYFFVSLDKDNVIVADILAGIASGFLTPEIAKDKAYVRYTFIEGLTQAMLSPSRKFFSIHAAGIHKNGVSLILQGKAGSGKSSLAYASIKNGFQLLAEDVIHVKNQNGDIRLWGLPWKFHLLPDALKFFPELKSIKPRLQINGEWKLEFEIEDYYPGSALTNSKPGPLLLITRNQNVHAMIERVSHEEAVHEFEVLWHWEIGWTKDHEDAANSLLRNGVFRLYTGKNIFESLSLIDELVDQIAKKEIQGLPYETQTYPEIS